MGIESVAYQKVLKEAVDHVAPHIRTKEIKVDTDKQRRAQRLSVYFERGHIYHHPSQKDLIDEILTFPFARHDDQVDALGHAVFLSEEKPLRSYEFKPSGF
jgi:predicted phage terminase large subunit-like protein